MSTPRLPMETCQVPARAVTPTPVNADHAGTPSLPAPPASTAPDTPLRRALHRGFRGCAGMRDQILGTNRRSYISTSIVMVTSLVLGIVGLRYAYDQQQLAYQATELARWTAQKEFLELCLDPNATDKASNESCAQALMELLPAPPYIKFSTPSQYVKRYMNGEKSIESIVATVSELLLDVRASIILQILSLVMTLGIVLFWQKSRRRAISKFSANIDEIPVSIQLSRHNILSHSSRHRHERLRSRRDTGEHNSPSGVKNENVPLATWLFNDERDPDSTASRNLCVLQVTTARAELTVVKKLLGHGALLHIRELHRQRAVYSAINEDHTNVLTDILENLFEQRDRGSSWHEMSRARRMLEYSEMSPWSKYISFVNKAMDLGIGSERRPGHLLNLYEKGSSSKCASVQYFVTEDLAQLQCEDARLHPTGGSDRRPKSTQYVPLLQEQCPELYSHPQQHRRASRERSPMPPLKMTMVSNVFEDDETADKEAATSTGRERLTLKSRTH
ncbi:MAG: hypothetical protein Q9164_005553 [Protoblastenia rupestris]